MHPSTRCDFRAVPTEVWSRWKHSSGDAWPDVKFSCLRLLDRKAASHVAVSPQGEVQREVPGEHSHA